MMRKDYIPDTNLSLFQSDRYRMTSDTLHLARFMDIRKKDRVLEIGCNNGAILMMAALKTQGSCIGIDIDEASIDLARLNAKTNQLDMVEYANTSLQTFESRPFDVLVCNPPYFDHHQSPVLNAMDFDTHLTLEDLCQHSYRLLKDQGRLFIILKSHRLAEAIALFERHRFALKRIRCIHHSLSHPASSVCLEWRKGGKSGLRIDAPVVQKKEV